MLADLVQFGSFGSELFTAADRLLADYLPQPLSRHIFPPPAFGKKAQRAQEEILKDTRIAQPAVGVVDLFAQDVLEAFGLYPSFAGGHSYGEYVALCAARACTREELLILSAKRGQAVHEVAESGAGGMAAANADAETVESALKEFGIPALIANFNAPKQTIIGGPREAIDAALEQLPKKGLAVRRVAVSAAFHTPAVKEASETIAVELDRINLRAPEFPVFSNVTAAPYPGDVPGVKALLNKHLAHPVRFVEQIEAMYEAGARVFVEAGPGRILTGLVKRILADKPHTTLALDMPGQPSWLPLGRLLAHAFAIGLPLDLAAWHRNRRLGGRSVEDYLAAVRLDEKGSPTDWWVDPAGSRPVRQPTPSPAKLVKGPEPAETPMKKQPASTPAPKAPPPTAGSPDLAGRLQEMTAQWLELQREQQRLTERFLALQERLLDAHLGTAPAATAPIPGAATVAPVGLPVAPAPVLPALDAAATEEAAPPAAPAPVRVAAEEEEDADAPPSVETFQRELVAEVSRRTGYPEDMLDLDLPLEAGLGIDSIKVMEIFSALKRYHPFLADPDQDEEDVLAQFTQLKTLGDIIRHYEERRLIAPASVAGTDEEELAAVPDAAMEAPAPAPAAPTEVERLVVKSVPAAIAGEIDLQGDVLPLPKDQGLLILGDVPAFGAAIRTGLESAGYTAWQVVPAASGAKSSGDGRFYSVDLGSPEAVASFAASVREEGKARVGAILNLLNLDEEFREPTLESADAALRLSRWLLCVAQAFEKDLRACAAEGGGLVVNVTSLDGRFGLSGNRPLPVAQAASIGFFKALAKEWREVRVKNLDVDPEAEPEILLTGLAGELSTGNGLIEVGFDTDGRWELDPSAASDGRSDEAAETADATEAASTEALPLDSESIVLCTGGAHGITADALRILASETHARLVIVGRSPRTTGDEEPDEIRNLVDAGGVREALIRKARADNGQLTPAEIEREVTRVLKNRAIRANLDAFEAAGSKVEYHTLDVRDEKALTEFIEKLYESHGRIDAVIHAAGVIEDHWIRDKTPESFARVFDTKVRPALVLARTLRPEGLKFVGFFSSVSARFGNAGQVDYSAANEVLNKLADHLDREWPGRVVSINWGPWDAGMVSEALRAAYAERGIGLISPSLGGRAFLEEVRRRDEHASEVVLACNIRRIARAGLGEPAS
jgi:acyl transferase domain-containing protein